MTLRVRFLAWALAMAAIAAVFGLTIQRDASLETDVLAMLPAADRDPAVEASARRLTGATGRKLLFLVGAADPAQARSAAGLLAERLREAGDVFSGVNLELRFDSAAIDALYAPHRGQLLSGDDRRRLRHGQGDALAQDALQALYTPAGWVQLRPFADDPLGLYGRFLSAQAPTFGRLHYEGGVLRATHDGRHYVLVTAETAGSPFAGNVQQPAMERIRAARQSVRERFPDSEILASGVLLHADANSRRAQQEISTFGSLSLIGVLLLLIVTFRSLRPLLLTLLSLGCGVLTALTACLLLFDRVHIVTLVFGSTLIGVAVDYSFHYFSDRFRQTGAWQPQETLRHVGPAILIGALTTALGYQAFLLPPFPGLRQFAVFSVAGVAAACACVLLAYPLLAGRGPPQHHPAVLRAAIALVRLRASWQPNRFTWLSAAALAALTALGLWQLQFVDDIRALQSPPATLVEQDARVHAILGHAPDTRFFLVRGATAEDVLQSEERLREKLDALVAAQALAGYSAVSRALPSRARQLEDHRLLAESVYAPDGALPKLLTALGYPPQDVARYRAVLPPAPEVLQPERWRASPASAALRDLWLDDFGDAPATAVTLSGLRDVAAARTAADLLPGVQFVDRVESISQLMQRYRNIALLCLGGAYLVIALGLTARYGLRAGLRLLAAPVAAALFTLAALGLAQIPASLFNVLALVLVLGFGIDYSVFLHEGRIARHTALAAILLAGMTTLLAFGMLSFSATPFIRSIGLTVVIGVSFTFVLALLCSAPEPGDKVTAPDSPSAT
jgi:predicted exporter